MANTIEKNLKKIIEQKDTQHFNLWCEFDDLQKKVALLEEHNNILFDYADNKMIEGCEEATKLINNLIK